MFISHALYNYIYMSSCSGLGNNMCKYSNLTLDIVKKILISIVVNICAFISFLLQMHDVPSWPLVWNNELIFVSRDYFY
jgi:hypothetical protein